MWRGLILRSVDGGEQPDAVAHRHVGLALYVVGADLVGGLRPERKRRQETEQQRPAGKDERTRPRAHDGDLQTEHSWGGSRITLQPNASPLPVSRVPAHSGPMAETS